MSRRQASATAATPPAASPSPRRSGGHPDPLDLRGVRCRVGHLGLEHDPTLLDPGERPAEPDQLTDPRPVDGCPTVGTRGRRRPPRCTWRRRPGREPRSRRAWYAAPPGRAPPSARTVEGEVRLVPPGLACRAPAVGDGVPQRPHGVLEPDDGDHRPWSGQRPLGERARVVGGALDGHQVGADMAARDQAPVVVPAPDLAGEQPRLEVGAAGAVLGERVHHRVARR